MILLLIMDFFQGIAYQIVSFIPDLTPVSVSISSSINLIAPALSIFPLDMFSFIVTNGLFWLGLHLIWSIIEWVYKKIPGVS